MTKDETLGKLNDLLDECLDAGKKSKADFHVVLCLILTQSIGLIHESTSDAQAYTIFTNAVMEVYSFMQNPTEYVRTLQGEAAAAPPSLKDFTEDLERADIVLEILGRKDLSERGW